MQMRATVEAGCQVELWERAALAGGMRVPRVRPVADEELTSSFVKAAAAWARWQEKRRWSAR